MNRSPTRTEYLVKKYKDSSGKPKNGACATMIKRYARYDEEDRLLEQDIEWRKDNLEYDLRSTDWIIEKAKNDKVYAQHIYAALCNNEFQRNDVWPILAGKTWSCSWRHAGGIVADMLEEGDYSDWYLTGASYTLDELDNIPPKNSNYEETKKYLEKRSHVDEGTITDEISDDLFKLGWIVVTDIKTD